ncbi:MAG: acyl-CoA dehydrogenase family protein [Roseibium sp.]|nr:acyl-CoA dehydrogenase family protein [Roseibium sp.]
MPPYQGDQDLWRQDTALRDWVKRFGGDWAEERLARAGKEAGAEATFEKADAANRNPPQLKAFDRYGMRINQVEFHPAYHDLMDLAVRNEVSSFAWNHKKPGSQVAHMALTYMFSQPEGGVMCPMAMTYAVLPVLFATKGIGGEWIKKLLSTTYDRRDIPVTEKAGATAGMFMTEKQGGSDVRSNSTRATPVGPETGEGRAYLLNGHKFFCSAPMSDAFLTLAYTEKGLSCFLVPRWTPDGQRNVLSIQRLKDKLGNRSNASSEMEFQDTWGLMTGTEGKGIQTIIEMVKGTRIYCAASSAAMMRQGLVQALHHTSHRSAFQKRLIQQPLMRNVLADLAVESEAAVALVMRVAKALDHSKTSETEAVFARIGTAIAKYWICKRAPGHLFEAMECHGGSGYVEESVLPRLYREAPVNSIWEGSGNVMCLDVLRAMHKEPMAIPVILGELEGALGKNGLLDQEFERLKNEFANAKDLELRARALTERIAIALQAALLLSHGPAATAEAFCLSRLGSKWTGAYGTLPPTVEFDAILERAEPEGI